MKIDQLNELELAKILKIAQKGEIKLKEMSDRSTMMAEKWRIKTSIHNRNTQKNNTGDR